MNILNRVPMVYAPIVMPVLMIKMVMIRPDDRQRFDFTEPHRTDRDERHVESIEEGHAFEDVIAERSECDECRIAE